MMYNIYLDYSVTYESNTTSNISFDTVSITEDINIIIEFKEDE